MSRAGGLADISSAMNTPSRIPCLICSRPSGNKRFRHQILRTECATSECWMRSKGQRARGVGNKYERGTMNDESKTIVLIPHSSFIVPGSLRTVWLSAHALDGNFLRGQHLVL